MRRLFRKIHKWIFIFVGVAMFIWVGTGIFMSLPLVPIWKTGPITEKADYSAVKTTVADAVATIKQNNASFERPVSVQLQRHKQYLAYVVTGSKRNKYLVNAVTGEYFQFSKNDAESLTRQVFNIDQPVLENKLVRHHNTNYPYGVLPVYKIRFKGSDSDAYFVNPTDAKVHRRTLLMRVRAIAGILHDFGPVRKLLGSDTARWSLLLFVSILAFIGTVAGMYLTLPKRKRS